MYTTTVASAATTSNCWSEPVKLLKRIGSTTYTVNVHFSNNSSEKLEDKVLRLIESEAGRSAAPNCSPMRPGVSNSA